MEEESSISKDELRKSRARGCGKEKFYGRERARYDAHDEQKQFNYN